MRRIGGIATAAVLALSLTACGSVSGSSSGGSGGGSGGAGGNVETSSTHQAANIGGAAGGAPHSSDSGAVGKGKQDCFATFQPLENRTGIDLGASIKGTLWVKCIVTPTEHTLNLELQRKVNGSWSTAMAKSSSALPPPMYIPVLVTVPCIPGDWRLHWSVTGNVNGDYFAGSATGEVRHVEAKDCA